MVLRAAHKLILTTCLGLQRAIAESHRQLTPETVWRWRDAVDHDHAYGPRYRPSVWFGNVTPAQSKRFQRAIADLHQAGYLVGTAGPGGRLTHIKLTPKGETLAKQLSSKTDAAV